MAKFSHFLAAATKRGQHVAPLLLLLLPATSLIINNVTDVAPFPDLSINFAFFGPFAAIY
jgi:hypothetical protein